MAKYKKKPIIVDIVPYQPGMEDGKEPNCKERGLCQDSCGSCPKYMPYIQTLEGKHFISPGDYIVTGIKGERYPIKPDILKMTYELMDE